MLSEEFTVETPARVITDSPLIEAVRACRAAAKNAQQLAVQAAQAQVLQAASTYITSNVQQIVDAMIFRAYDADVNLNAAWVATRPQTEVGTEAIHQPSLFTVELFQEVLANISPEFLSWCYNDAATMTIKNSVHGAQNIAEYLYNALIRPELKRRIQMYETSRSTFEVLEHPEGE